MQAIWGIWEWSLGLETIDREENKKANVHLNKISQLKPVSFSVIENEQICW